MKIIIIINNNNKNNNKNNNNDSNNNIHISSLLHIHIYTHKVISMIGYYDLKI